MGKSRCPVSIIISNGDTKPHLLSHSLHLAQILSESYAHFSVHSNMLLNYCAQQWAFDQ